MRYTQDALNIIAMQKKGATNKQIYDNYKKGMNESDIIEIMKKIGKSISPDDFHNAESALEQMNGDGCITFCDDDFPFVNAHLDKNQTNKNEEEVKGKERLLFDFKDSLPSDKNRPNRNEKINEGDIPILFCYKGDLKLLWHKFNVAVIGILKPSKEIEEIEQKVVAEFAKYNACIVSGLALGCDTIAHKEAMKNNATTVAILPSTLDRILPKENSQLAEDIAGNGGLLLTEYAFEPYPWRAQIKRYTDRDRLQALFSDMVILSASYCYEDTKKDKSKDSGSRHAMGKTKDYGIRRAVIYDESFNGDEMFNLNRQIIVEETGFKGQITNEFINEVNEKYRKFKIINQYNAGQIVCAFAKHKGIEI